MFVEKIGFENNEGTDWLVQFRRLTKTITDCNGVRDILPAEEQLLLKTYSSIHVAEQDLLLFYKGKNDKFPSH